MPKNTYFIKENYKKVEEIREIKNEIPTYEEFLRNYQADQEVSESYENELNSYNDIGVSKGFGPCRICYKDTQWMNLHIGCPARDCPRMSNVSYWYHSSSGYLNASDQYGCGRLEISNKGEIKCQGCGTSSSIRNWSFKCSSQRDYRSVDEDSWNAAFMLAIRVNSGQVARDLGIYMLEHRFDW